MPKHLRTPTPTSLNGSSDGSCSPFNSRSERSADVISDGRRTGDWSPLLAVGGFSGTRPRMHTSRISCLIILQLSRLKFVGKLLRSVQQRHSTSFRGPIKTPLVRSSELEFGVLSWFEVSCSAESDQKNTENSGTSFTLSTLWALKHHFHRAIHSM